MADVALAFPKLSTAKLALPPLIDCTLRTRNRQGAINAISIILFALAKGFAAVHTEYAFQASSPKNF